MRFFFQNIYCDCHIHGLSCLNFSLGQYNKPVTFDQQLIAVAPGSNDVTVYLNLQKLCIATARPQYTRKHNLKFSPNICDILIIQGRRLRFFSKKKIPSNTTTYEQCFRFTYPFFLGF